MQITVAVCTYRRFDWLLKCLYQLKKQTLPLNNFRIVVVDNSLQPEKSEVFRKGLSGLPNLEYVITEKAGLSYSRNIALEKCKTPYIAYIDDDALADPYWVENILRCFKHYNGSVGVVGGRVRPIWEISKPDWLEGNLCHHLAVLDWGDEEFVIQRDDPGKWLVGANLCYDVAGLRKAGGFPEYLGRTKDLLLCHEELAVNDVLRDMGYIMIYCPNASVDHLVQKERISLRWLCKNAFWEAVSHAMYASKKTSDCVLTVPMREELNATLEGLFESFEPKISQEEAEKERHRFREAGHVAIREYGFIPEAPPNVSPCVYVVTPCINARQYIDQCIDSVVSQAGDFYIRYHIQDGGSADGTLQRLTAWKEELDSGQHPLFCRGVTFTFASTLDDGMYDAISKGFKCMDIPAKAAMTWINSDDYLMPGAIASVQKAFSLSEDVSLIIGAVHSCTEKSYPFACHRFGFPLALIRSGLCDGHHWQHVQQEGTFWRKCLWDKVGGLDLSCKYAGDWDLWRRFAKYCTPVQTDWPLGCFRSRPNQLSAKHMDLYNAEVESRASFAQRQNALNRLIGKDDIRIHVLVGTSDKNYEIKETYLKPENIPGCTWQNCPDFAATLLNHPVPADMNEVNKTKRDLLPRIKAVQTTLSQDVTFTKSSWEKTHWQLSPVPDQPNVFFATGWHSQESDTTGWWRWCAGQGIIHVKAFKLQKASLFLTLASTLNEDEISIHLNGKEVFYHTVGLESREFGPVALQLKAGINIVLIHSKQTPANFSNDFKSQNFMVRNVRIERSKPGFLDVGNRFALTRMARLIRKSRLFLPTYYLHQIPELKENNQCPEVHYLLYGAWENKNPNPLFDSAWYLSQYRDIYVAGENPLCHYMIYGWKEGRDPHPEFSTERYLSDYEDVKKSGMNPLLHYLLHGILEGRKIHPGT
jgi:glycosyltransferase involved in cell wall biosynthesis